MIGRNRSGSNTPREHPSLSPLFTFQDGIEETAMLRRKRLQINLSNDSSPTSLPSLLSNASLFSLSPSLPFTSLLEFVTSFYHGITSNPDFILVVLVEHGMLLETTATSPHGLVVPDDRWLCQTSECSPVLSVWNEISSELTRKPLKARLLLEGMLRSLRA